MENKTRVVYAPNHITAAKGERSVFLAGSIEMGQAEEWQEKVIKMLKDQEFAWVVFNPRRTDWDSSWEQSIENPQFRRQVNWELAALERASYVLLYLSPGTKSPISLLEFGLYARWDKLIVVCPEGFWRKGNVDIVCARYGVSIYQTLRSAVDLLAKLREFEYG